MKVDFTKAICKISFAQIGDALLLVFVILGLVILLIAPIWLSLLMPTGT
jgi:hypothetical protein